MAEEQTLVLILLVVVMLLGSYMAGSIPLVMKLSEEKLKSVTVLGAGLLVGTALTVIIPEGISSLYMKDKVSSNDVVNAHTMPAPAKYSDYSNTEHNYFQSEDHSRTIGLSLILGFVFMMLVDQISQRKSSKNDKNITATLGLVVHAAADGVALGAAATTSHQDVEMIVFLAIMLHKAPAAFGLVSFLLHEKIDRHQIRKHLGVFSMSAPMLTLLTYFGIGQEQKETLNSVNATGIAMLFSAGTFLYVATVHVLPELTAGHQHKSTSYVHEYRTIEDSLKDGDLNIVEQQSYNSKGLRYSELIIMIFGTLLPLIITFGHQH